MAIKYIKCPDCGGLGFIKDFIGDYHSCPTCHGARFLEADTMDLKELKEEVDGHMEHISEEVNESMNKKVDPTNPDHYKEHTSLECIEEMEIIFGSLGVIYFCVCNAWKYIRRWKNKNGAEDLKKAKWYIEKAWELIDGEFAASARHRFSDLLTRMSDYINKVEGRMKNDKDN